MITAKSVRLKIWFISAVLVAFAVVAGYRLVKLHTGAKPKDPPAYRSTKKLPPSRGAIYDASGSGSPFALSFPVWDYHLDPKSVKDPALSVDALTTNEMAKIIADSLGLDYNKVLAKFGNKIAQYIPLGMSDDDNVHRKLTSSGMSGMVIEERQIRRYPHGESCAHVVGFVNALGDGCEGLEAKYNSMLNGQPGTVTVWQDARGKEIYSRPRELSVPAVAGADIYLTIDGNIQLEVENALAEAVATNNARSGWAVVEDVETGAILAMASYPSFNPAKFLESPKENWRNRAIEYCYEPGSVMKTFTMAAAINENIVRPTSIYDAFDGTWVYGGKVLHDHPRGKLSVAMALAESSNIVTAQIGLQVGAKRLWEYLKAFGFGSRTKVELPGETPGILRKYTDWRGVAVTRIPIGQGVGVTAVQLANAYAAIANGGNLLKPYIIEKIISPESDSPVYSRKREVAGNPITKETAYKIRRMLMGVVEHGTGKRAHVKGYSVAGKTGTSQQVVNGKYSDKIYWATFCGIVPASAPKLSIVVTIDNPQPKHTGGWVACPVFARIASAALKYLEIPPDRPDELED